MAERNLIPINQQMQFRAGWSNGYSGLDVELRGDNPATEFYINRKFLRGLPRLGGCVLAFTCEIASDAIPEQYRRTGMFDLSLGSEVVRLTTGSRLEKVIRWDERDTIWETASNLDDNVWVFDAKHLEEYVEPEPQPVPPKKPSRLVTLLRGR